MKRSETKAFIKLCNKYKINPESYDIDAVWDSSLKARENWDIIENDLREKGNPLPNLEKDNAQYQEYIEKEIKRHNENAKMDLKPELEQYFRPIERPIEKLANGFENLVLIKGRAGIGKTFNIKNYLIKYGIFKKTDVAVDCSEAYFIDLLWKNRDGGIVWIKDIVRLLKNQNILDNLKSATEDNPEDRWITNYNYSKQKRHIDRKFLFNGSFIFDYNEIYDNRFKADFDALRSRGSFVELVFNKEDIKDIMRKICKTEWQKEVTEYLINHYVFVGHQNFNLRLQHNAFNTYLNSRKMGRDWKKDLFYELKYNTSPIKSMLYEFMGKNIVTSTELKKWLVRSGRIGCLRTAERRINEWIELGEIFKVTENKYKYGLSLFPKNCDKCDNI